MLNLNLRVHVIIVIEYDYMIFFTLSICLLHFWPRTDSLIHV